MQRKLFSLFMISFLTACLLSCLCFVWIDSSHSMMVFCLSLISLFTLNAWRSSKKIDSELQKIASFQKEDRIKAFEILSEGFVVLDKNFHIEYINYAALKMLGMSKKDSLVNSFSSSPCKHTSLQEACFKLAIASEKHNTVVTDSFCSDSMKKVYYDIVASPRPSKAGYLIALSDKSSHHKVFEMGKDFVANASHELRTPITIIKGFAETLQDMKQMPLEMLDGIIEKIVRNSQRMESLVKNLLTLADLENLSISEHQVSDLVTLACNCKQITQAIYTDADITIDHDQSPILANADSNILELAVINLLSNAAKYSSGSAKIHVAIQAVQDEAKLIISDQGIGIAKEDIDHIFERFFTVNKAHSRKLGGAGLGLSLVKLIIEKHHGSIEVSSELGKGSCFTITLPLSKTFKTLEEGCSVR